jgi:hypothetical protein
MQMSPAQATLEKRASLDSSLSCDEVRALSRGERATSVVNERTVLA